MNKAKRINELRELVATQEAHVERMVAHNSPTGAVNGARRVAMTFRAELANLESGGSWTTADFNTATATARAAFPFVGGRSAVAK